LVDSELLAEAEPMPSDCSDGETQNLETLRKQKWRAKKAEQTTMSKENPVAHMAGLVFESANFPGDWQDVLKVDVEHLLT